MKSREGLTNELFNIWLDLSVITNGNNNGVFKLTKRTRRRLKGLNKRLYKCYVIASKENKQPVIKAPVVDPVNSPLFIPCEDDINRVKGLINNNELLLLRLVSLLEVNPDNIADLLITFGYLIAKNENKKGDNT